MSADLWLEDDAGHVLHSEHRIQEGGTQCLGGTDLCELNITYNYFGLFYLTGVDLHEFPGRRARETESELTRAVAQLGTRRSERSYWEPTPGNAGFALSILLGWVREHGAGIWRGSF